jgi:hypothetical protein
VAVAPPQSPVRLGLFIVGEVPMKQITMYFLAAKYWGQGDDWISAKDYARAIVFGFRV